MRKVKLFLSLALLVCFGLALASCDNNKNSNEHTTHVDANKDCTCDVCGVEMDTHKPGAKCVCDTCGFDFHKDQEYYTKHVKLLDSDYGCEVCGKSFAKTNLSYDYVDSATCAHQDKDGNCVCDVCFTGLGHSFESGVCKTCGLKKRDNSKSNTYYGAFSTSPSTWNPHTQETSDDGDAADMLMSGLYEFYFNGDKTGFEIWPVMASAYPEDVTMEVKNMPYNYGIPADATEHYAYKIRLNKNATWDDGTKIKAEDWVESFKLLMDPLLYNYRAADQMSGDVVVAGCKEYYYQGKADLIDNMTLDNPYTFADFVKHDDGVYYTESGLKVSLAYSFGLAALEGDSLKDYIDYYGDMLFDVEACKAFAALADYDGIVPLTDESYQLFQTVVENFAEGEEDYPLFFVFSDYSVYDATYSFDKVGMFVDPKDEYAFYMVLAKPAFGFYYIYGLSSWLVKVDAYKAGMKPNATGTAYTTDYNTTLETTHSYGPYMMSVFQLNKEIDYVRNDNWFGYKDPRFDCMYHTSAVNQQQVKESATRKEMFLKGELMSYGLQPADYADYGQSNYYYVSPGSTVFFMILAADENVLSKIEGDGVNKTILCNDDFRHALSLSFNKSEFSQKISPARTPAYSVVGAYDIWNLTTGEKYRNTEIAKKALVEFYGYTLGSDGKYHIEGSTKAYTLDEANDAVNGYAPDVAKVLFDKAYDAWKAAGKISDTDVVKITYATSETSDFQTRLLNELNRQLTRTLEGTKLEGRVMFDESPAYGNDWSKKLKSCEAQTCLAGWRGGMLNPFGSMLYYLDPDHDPYAKTWWDTTVEELELTLPVGKDGANVTIKTSLANWSKMLTGDTTEVNGVKYNFGYAQVADEVRLTILAAFEKEILGTDYYIPFMQDASGFLLSQRVKYVLGREDYNAVLGRGGMTYMTYDYDDAEWAAYVKAQGGTLTY